MPSNNSKYSEEMREENGLYSETQKKYKPTHNGKVTGVYSKID